MLKTVAALALTAGLLAAGAPALARAQEPAAQTVDRLDAALLESMKAGKTESTAQRFRQLQPVVNRAFNLSAMIKVAVGPAWAKMSPADQAALTTAFARFTAANYARNFDGYSGQKFVAGAVDTRLPDKLVHTQLQSPGGSPVSLVYRLRQGDGGWKIIDVFFNGSISSLAQQASDFSSTVATGGAPALVRKLNAQSDQLLK